MGPGPTKVHPCGARFDDTWAMTSPVRRPETMALALAGVSGFVDAFVYLRVYPVFTANQSGNLILAGIALGEGRWAAAAVSLIALASYMAGAALGIGVFSRGDAGIRDDSRHRFVAVLSTEIAVLGSLMLLGVIFRGGFRATTEVDAPVLCMVAATSLAMGLQGVALRRVRGVSVLTTGGTGNVTTIGERIGRLGTPKGLGSDELALGVLGGVVTIYVVGAVFGALGSRIESVGWALVVVPVAGLAGALLVEVHNAGRSQ